MVFVWMTAEVSPRCQYSLFVVIVRVTLQLAIETAITMAVRPAINSLLDHCVVRPPFGLLDKFLIMSKIVFKW